MTTLPEVEKAMAHNRSQTRRLVVCFDGTWNNVEARTNVSRLFEAILDRGMDGVAQLKFYDEGVDRAIESTIPWSRLMDGLRGGTFGDGIVPNVLQAYPVTYTVVAKLFGWNPWDLQTRHRVYPRNSIDHFIMVGWTVFE